MPAIESLDVMRRRRGGGDELLAWKDGRSWKDLSSADVNDYIRTCFGIEATAKDFRTWHATVIAAAALAETDEPGKTKASRKRAVVERDEGGLGRSSATPRRSRARPTSTRGSSRPTSAAARSRCAASYDTDDARQAALERAVLKLLADGPEPAQLCATTWSIAAVSFSTSDGSIAGYIAIRSWLRPSLR